MRINDSIFLGAIVPELDNGALVIQQNKRILFLSLLSRLIEVVVRGVPPLALPDAIANSLAYLKAFGGTEQRDIPDNYLQRQFIYMMDGSYLLTDIVPTYDGRVEMDFQTTTMPSTGGAFVGGRNNSYPAGLTLGWNQTSKYVLFDGFGNPGLNDDRYVSTTPFENNTRYKYIFDNQNAKLLSNGATIINYTFTKTNANGSNLSINGLNNNGTVIGNVAGIYLYSFKVWNGQGELVMDLVPAVQKGTVPVVGFYDTVSKTFKTATAGTFAAGGEAVPTPDTPMDIVSNNGVLKARHQSGLPLGYTLLDSITGSTNQAIMTTGVPGDNDNLRFKLKAQKLNFSAYTTFFANYVNEDSKVTRIIGGTSQSAGIIAEVNRKAAGSTTSNAARITDEHEYELYKNAEGVSVLIVDGEIVDEMGNNADATENNTIIAINSSNVRETPAETSATDTTYKYFKIYDNGVLIRDYIPARRESDSKVGFYDLVNDNFIASIFDTYPFTAGSPVSDPVEIYTDGTVETINVHGKNLFDKDTATVLNLAGSATSSLLTINDRYGIYIPVQPNTTYTISRTGSSYLNLFEAATVPAVGVSTTQYTAMGTASSYTITTAATSNYLYIFAGGDSFIDSLQIEEGSTATAYVPYFNGGTATAEMLLKVGNYEDVQSIIDGVVTRNVGVYVCDGTESGWFKTNNSFANTSLLADKERSTLLCSHFQYDTGGTSEIPDGCIGDLGVSTAVYFRYDTCNTVADWKQWLADQYAAGTPVIVVYPLATPTTESVAGQTMQVQQGDNFVEITQASLNNLELEAKYQAAVSLTIQEVQDANLDPNVQVTIN